MVGGNNRVKKMMQRRETLARQLPLMEEVVRGSLITRFRRCGKPYCHCVRSKGHGPAHYLTVTLKPGKTEQILLSEEMVPVVRQYLDNYHRWWATLEKVSAINRWLVRMRAPELAEGVKVAGSKQPRGKRPGTC